MSSSNEKNSLNFSTSKSISEIKSTLLSIYDKINKSPTKEVGYDLFLKLINDNLHSSSHINLIINHIGEFIYSLVPKEKEPCLKLLSLIFYSPDNDDGSFDPKIYYPYLSPVLTTIQNLIKDTNTQIFPTISNIFAEIVQNIMPTDIEASNIELNEEEKTAYEMLQGFCIYNMKYEDKSNRVVGSLCLTKLVENCPIVLQSQYMKLIWEVIISLIDKKSFNAKYELLNCLISLILGAENLFTPYANTTLYKVLDFLADVDWLKRKLALNVIYTLIFYCKEEILPLKEHIISFLRTLKSDKVKEVREVCLLILKIFSENEPKTNKDKYKVNSLILNKKKIAKNKNNKKEKFQKTVISKKSMNTTKESEPNKDLKNSSQTNKKTDTNISSNKFSECLIPEMRNKTFEIEGIEKKGEVTNSDKKESPQINDSSKEALATNKEISPIQNNKNVPKKFEMTLDNKNTLSNLNENISVSISQNKFVNRKDDKSFINEKMVIKPDPNKSIFKTNPNPAFFNQAKNKSKDLVVLVAKEPKKKESIVKANDEKKNEKKEEKNEGKKTQKIEEIKEKKEEKIENINPPKKEENIKNLKTSPDIKNLELEKITSNNNKEPKDTISKRTEKKFNDKKKDEKPPIKNSFGPINRNKSIKKDLGKENLRDEETYKINVQEKIFDEHQIKFNNKYDKIMKKKEIDEEEEEEKDYKNYKKKSREKENIYIDEKNSDNNNYDPNLINTLLSQMNSLSEKQLSLLDVMDNIQMDTQEQIKKMNKRISKLEKNVEELNEELYNIKNNK